MSHKGPAGDGRYVHVSLRFIRGQDDDLIAFVEGQARGRRGPAIKALMRAGLNQGDAVQAILEEVRTTVHRAVGDALENRVVTVADAAPPPDEAPCRRDEDPCRRDEDPELAAALDSIAF
jgi:hypothetical protein